MLKHGILGLLNYGDKSGYEIREIFRVSLNYFWTAQTSQIYRELNELEKKGFIVKHIVEQEGKPDKNICSITDKGRKELLKWLSEPYVGTDIRSQTLMKTFFMGELPVSDGIEFFEQINKKYNMLLNNLKEADYYIKQYDDTVDEKKAMFWQMSADFGKRYMQTYIDWTEYCIKLLKNMEEDK